MQQVEIQVAGRIDPRWSEWFDHLTITAIGPEQSLLAGTVTDQAALYGILTKLRDLSLALISVSVETDASECRNGSKEKGDTL